MPYIVLVSQEARERVADLRRQILHKRTLAFKETIESVDTGFWHNDFSPGWKPADQLAHYQRVGVPIFIPGISIDMVENWLLVWEATDDQYLQIPPELLADLAAPALEFWAAREPQEPPKAPMPNQAMAADPQQMQAFQAQLATKNDAYQAEHQAWEARMERIRTGQPRDTDLYNDWWRSLFEVDRPQASRHLRNFVNLTLRKTRKEERKPPAAAEFDMEEDTTDAREPD